MFANAATVEDHESRYASHDGARNLDEGKDDPSSETSVSSAKEGLEPSEGFAGKETALVFRLRVLVILALLSAAAAVSAVVYKITADSEADEFESQFAGSATKILSSFENIVQDKIAAVGSLALAATIYTANNNITWPFVALDSFQERAAIAKSLSDAIFIGMYPIVFDENRTAWEEFAQDHFYHFCNEAIIYQNKKGVSPFGDKVNPLLQTQEELAASYFGSDASLQGNVDQDAKKLDFSTGVANHMFYTSDEGINFVDPGPDPYFPLWQSSPFTTSHFINLNLNTAYSVSHRGLIDKSFDLQKVVMGGFSSAPPGDFQSNTGNYLTNLIATWLSFAAGESVTYLGDPITNVYVPVFDSLGAERSPVGIVNAVIHWISFFQNVLPENIRGVTLVLQSPCTEPFTYVVDGPEVTPIGSGDLHDLRFDHFEHSASMADFSDVSDGSQLGLELETEDCPYSIHVYPSQVFYDDYHTNAPIIITLSVAIIFVFTVVMFIVYDRLVEKRNSLVVRKATTTSKIVTSLFPKNIADRLMQEQEAKDEHHQSFMSANRRLRTYLSGGEGKRVGQEPIADLFPNASCFFADIAGFTAWSSTRDPAQVFTLLQTIYQAFDAIALRRKVFKVETVGDSYVAVAGIPDPQPTHAVIIARFAWDCHVKFNELVKEMEVELGPDTGDLQMRFGINSGPITAGVLLGERARFQLFGDTVNMASRMECTGVPNRIQVSQATAELLREAGKSSWLTQRSDVVHAKGKGVLTTYWLNLSSGAEKVAPLVPNSSQAFVKQTRMIKWMVEVFLEHINTIYASRNYKLPEKPIIYSPKQNKITLDEVVEVICLPSFDSFTCHGAGNNCPTAISSTAVEQLCDYISNIASLYCQNPFHNFEHACHVTMAVDKFMKRIVNPNIDVDGDHSNVASHLHDYTHGINSDPLTLFAIVFSALIHDVDHRGVSNVQLAKEEKEMATMYHNKSIAEQNSLDIAWDLLMEPQYSELWSYLFCTEADILRFRQVIVNVVLATDIFDKELNDLRKARWNKAFSGELEGGTKYFNDLRATIVIEHIIQASDVSHTMQHWHVYRKWNEKLFKEMYMAFKAGRMGADPSTFWYKGEIAFFDNYIIPLAKKLKDCNVFGVSSDECLNYAMMNRAEWEERGDQITKEMIAKLVNELGPGSNDGRAQEGIGGNVILRKEDD
ncbi:PAS domain containing protein [Nitzschia inconspicua]|uniref:PAS domain containing protein n=1 Tax=Nitzschia inconspicua TaxID=303405 RepID=A0A9K3KDN1_9STRA|nr:PAS domain containing protein [Nitzschia inconspicua]